MERQIFDRMAELSGDHWWFTARRAILADLIARVARPPGNARLLEIGAATGHNLDMLRGFGTLDAIEYDAEARAVAAARLGKPLIDSALPDLAGVPDSTYDLVALLDVLEHVDDDAGSLAAIRRVLKPGGALLLTVPANKWMWSAHDVAHHHKRRYTRAELAAAIERAGFTTSLLSHFNTLLFPPIAAVRALGKLTGRAASDDAMPSPGLNRLLGRIFGIESRLIGRVPMPFGVSLVAVVRRPIDAD